MGGWVGGGKIKANDQLSLDEDKLEAELSKKKDEEADEWTYEQMDKFIDRVSSWAADCS